MKTQSSSSPPPPSDDGENEEGENRDQLYQQLVVRPAEDIPLFEKMVESFKILA